MRKLSLVLVLLLFFSTTNAQQDVINSIIHKRDSILQLLQKETNPDEEARLVMSIYNISIDGFPLLVLDWGQKLLTMGREKKDLVIEILLNCVWPKFWIKLRGIVFRN